MKIVIFKNDDNSVSVLIPTPEALSFATIEQIATKDVPAGVPFKVINYDDLPPRETRPYWRWDDTITPDGYGGKSNQFDKDVKL